MRDYSALIDRRVLKRWKYLNFIDWLLPAYVVMSMPLFYMGLHFESIFKGGVILVSLFFIYKFGIPKGKNVEIFTIFLLLIIFSFIQYAYNDRPISCFFRDASNYISSMLFLYIGASDDRPNRNFYDIFLYSTVIVFAIGLVFYVLTPSWYVVRNLEIINASSAVEYSENSILSHLRYGAFWGDSYSVSHLSVFCSAIAIFNIAYNKGTKRNIGFICLIVGIASSIACMHRASLLGSVIAIGIYFYFNMKTNRNKENILILIFGFCSLVALVVYLPGAGERLVSLQEMVTERVDGNMNLGDALRERKFTKEVLDSMKFFIFGHGLGSGGGGVRAYGYPGINDMQYIKMFYENGLVGAFLFVLIIFAALKRGFKYIRFYLTEVTIILFILVAMLGSNSLCIYYFIVYPFWYAIGRIFNNNYLQNIKNGNNSFLSSPISSHSK